jgi:hypothetical protein
MRKILFLAFVLLTLSPGSLHAEFRAGIAVRIVTPDPLLPVSGGVGPSHPVNRKEGDLTVRALVLENNDVRVAIVSADFLGFPSVLGNKARAQVKGIVPENILIGATHTHSAPDCYGFPDGKGGFAADLKYLDLVCNRVAEAINEAVARLQPASLKIATGEAKGKITYNYYAEQLYDPRCHVIQAVGADGKPFATLVNYAIHPEVLGSDAGILAPDLIGPLYDRIREKGGGIGIFMNSAQGGMVTADNRGPSWQHLARGRSVCESATLADEATDHRVRAGTENPKLFLCREDDFIPVDSDAAGDNGFVALGYPDKDAAHATTQLNLVNIGNAQILLSPARRCRTSVTISNAKNGANTICCSAHQRCLWLHPDQSRTGRASSVTIRFAHLSGRDDWRNLGSTKR